MRAHRQRSGMSRSRARLTAGRGHVERAAISPKVRRILLPLLAAAAAAPLGLTKLALFCICPPLLAHDVKSFDAAAAFGARPSVSDLSLSPDGMSVAYIAPIEGQGSVAYTLSLAEGAKAKLALVSAGKPERLGNCRWVSNERLVCLVYAVIKDPAVGFLPFTRLVAVNADGTNPQVLSKRENAFSRGLQLGGGNVIDWLPDEDGAVLMTRQYLPDDRIGTRFGSSSRGLAVDWIDTRTLAVKHIESPRTDAVQYVTDGRGTVRIIGIKVNAGKFMDSGIISYMYRS